MLKQHRTLAVLGFIVDPKRVPHVPRGVVLGDVEHLEVVPVPLDLRPLHDAEAHRRERGAYLPHHLDRRMNAAPRDRPARQSHVDRVAHLGGALERGFTLRHRLLERLPERVGGSPDLGTLLGRQRAEAAQKLRQLAAPTHERDAPLVQ